MKKIVCVFVSGSKVKKTFLIENTKNSIFATNGGRRCGGRVAPPPPSRSKVKGQKDIFHRKHQKLDFRGE